MFFDEHHCVVFCRQLLFGLNTQTCRNGPNLVLRLLKVRHLLLHCLSRAETEGTTSDFNPTVFGLIKFGKAPELLFDVFHWVPMFDRGRPERPGLFVS